MGYKTHGGGSGGTGGSGAHGGATSLEIFDSVGSLNVSVNSSDIIGTQSLSEVFELSYGAAETLNQQTVASSLRIPVQGDALATPTTQSLSTITSYSAETNGGQTTQQTFDANVRSNETNPAPLEAYLSTLSVYRAETNNVPTDAVSFIATAQPYADSVVSNTNWTNPNNALGDTTSTSATLSATSSGLGGLTSNTVNGTLILSFPDLFTPGTIDLTLYSISQVTISFEYSQVAGSGLGNSSTRVVDYSLNNGSSWINVMDTGSAQAKTIATYTITPQVTGGWSQLNNLQMRWTGSVVSGIGSGSTTSTNWFRAWATVTASYTP